MTNAQRDKRVEVAQVRVLFQVPFFAAAVARLPIVWDETVGTACTNGKVIRWCPSWFDTLEDQHLVTLLCHEACHPLLGHLWRLPPPAGDHELANIACVTRDVLILLADGKHATARRIKVGDKLGTPFGETVVLRVLRKRKSELARIRLANNRTLICTSDHPVITVERCCRAASECCGVEIFQTLVGQGQAVSPQELVEAFCYADSDHIRAQLHDLFSPSQAAWIEAFVRRGEREGRFGSIEKVEAMAAWLFGGNYRRGRNNCLQRCEHERTQLREAGRVSNNDLYSSRAGVGGDWLLLNQMPKHCRGGIHQGQSGQLGRLPNACEGALSVSHCEAPTSSVVLETGFASFAARLVRQPTWLERVSRHDFHSLRFERQKVISIEKFSRVEDVYDFITDIGCYVADGILVHNCDHAVNLMLKEFSALRMVGGFADPFPFPPGNYCCDEQYKGMSEEAVYWKLPSGQNGGSNGSTPSIKTRPRSNGAQKSGAGNGSGSNPGKFGEFEAPKEDGGANGTGGAN